MRISTLVIFAAFSCLASSAFACKTIARYQEHLWGSSADWRQPYRVVKIVEASDDSFVAIVQRNFANEMDIGKRVVLRFMANEEAHAVCSISLEVGKTYLVRLKSSTDHLVISRFNWYNIPSTHPKFDTYLQDLDRDEVRPMYVEANTITRDTQNNRVIARGKVQIFYKDSILFAEQVTDDRNVNQLMAEGMVLFRGPDGSVTHEDRLTLSDDYRDTFRSTLIEQRIAPWH